MPARPPGATHLALGATPPEVWDCPRHSARSTREDLPDPPPPPPVIRPPKRPWQMLRERRTIPELEDLLAERLALLQAQRRAHPDPIRTPHDDHTR
ncbi:RNA polymerase-binding protein RbpA [Streptoalloteichus tenebrarius]|uniref:RNA polymerase-binding protein RbpA n=1 Tax=Streptoalloteichus tenebrarius (strain ATCC 17920 / DSM 40477 / JCM 4838 / CBS 697.72 / NBRC 16177 / NCIMB 11028 / NRRL B-12390 / A12253. 1 / ISP 5477) TaxID=1933 RepID=UPI0020A5B1F8|nr:RNA polymerase-binding protein RbpA [Streptoalloteichus tenebrarius]BFE98413.1 hypothetical protein GCM10020241_00890 [Streptoalloteichus tenebrarius]